MNPTNGLVLLVDDDEFFRSMTEEILVSNGYQVKAVSDGITALASAEGDPPDLILLDLVLPRMSGMEVLRILKNNPATSEIPVLLITSERREENLLSGFRMGADDVLFKPLSSEELLARTEVALKRKRHIDALADVIRRHLDPNVAFQIIKQPQQTLQLKRTHLAVLFGDLRGFTQLAENIEPEQTASLLNQLFEQLVRCVLRHGGTLDKFLGDGLMALFGAPIGYPDNEDRAVCAALDMMHSLESIDLETSRISGGPIDFGIGISAGDVVVGPLGSHVRMNYTAIGDAVNVAARLTALARGREIIIGKNVRDRLDPQILVEPLPAAALKGKRALHEIFRVSTNQEIHVMMRRKT
jgi:adenylate cyclase